MSFLPSPPFLRKDPFGNEWTGDSAKSTPTLGAKKAKQLQVDPFRPATCWQAYKWRGPNQKSRGFQVAPFETTVPGLDPTIKFAAGLFNLV